jgi:DNA adenine methylase
VSAAPDMKISAIAPWFGGKRTLAPVIIEEAGDHRAWWELFCGGVSVILNKPRCRQETLNDLHGDLTNLGIVIASPRWVDFYERAVVTTYGEGLFNACKEAIAAKGFEFATDPDSVTDAQLRRAWAYLVLSWMGRNGASGTARINYQFTMRYTANGGDSATRWRGVVDSIPWWHERLHGVVFSRRDGIALAEKIDDAPGTFIYADPPYIEEGDAYEHAFASGGGMFGDDHQRLAEALRAKKHARVVVSYYDHPRLAELYPGWTVRRLTMAKALAAQNKRGANRESAPEVLLINGPSLAKGVA